MGADAVARDDPRQLAEEQAALLRVAALVAEAVPEDVLLTAVAHEVRDVVGVGMISIDRYEPDGSASTVIASVNDPGFPVGSRWPIDGPSLGATVFATGRPARVDDYAGMESTSAAAARDSSVTSSVGVPIVVDGAVWGIICVAVSDPEPLPPDTEERLAAFTELVAVAIADGDARRSLAALVDEQSALRRVATLVARGAPPQELFHAVAEEVGRLFHLSAVTLSRYERDAVVVIADPHDSGFPVGSRWPFDGDSLAARALATGGTARIDDYSGLEGTTAAAIRASSSAAAVGAPILVGGTVWGILCIGSAGAAALPRDTEERLARFSELVATAIANVEAQDDLRTLAEEQAALRRVATLVAEGAPTPQLLSAVAEQVGRVLDVPGVSLDRYDPDGRTTVLAAWGEIPFPAGTRWPVEPGTVAERVLATGEPARVNDYTSVRGGVAHVMRDIYPEACVVGAPIVVDGSVWGVIGVGTPWPGILPPDTESRLTAFTELVGTAIANTEARDGLRTRVDEQAGLRRVATLVAEGATTAELCSAVAGEVWQLFGGPAVTLDRYDGDGRTSTVLAHRGELPFVTGTRWAVDPGTASHTVLRTGRPARVESEGYARLEGEIADALHGYPGVSIVGVPIEVGGSVWGIMGLASSEGRRLPPDTEERLSRFTDLVATAIANADVRDRVRGLADEQAALHRVAALVARGADPSAVFDAVCTETGLLLGASSVNLVRFTPDGEIVLAGWSLHETGLPIGNRAAVGAPVVVGGQRWGRLVAATDDEEALPPGTERRLAGFTELVATAISNAATRAELIASRARLVAAGDQARRRIERNLHDRTQQQLIALGLDLQAVRASTPPELRDAHEGFARIEREIESVREEVRELAHGLHPALRARGGLGPSLRALAHRLPIEVDFTIETDDRPPEAVENGVYYVVSEALTNAIKHAQATRVSVTVTSTGTSLRAIVEDDGVGGAEPGAGSGLTGLLDRVEALGGRFAVGSPPTGGTRIDVELPLTEHADAVT